MSAGMDNAHDTAGLSAEPRDIESELFRKNARYHTRVTVIVSAIFLVVLILGAFLVQLSVQTADSLEILRRATGPEADADQAEVVEALLERIDCNSRQSNIELLRQVGLEVDEDAAQEYVQACRRKP